MNITIPEIPEGKWTKQQVARDREHSCINPRSEFAVCWCLKGWVDRNFVNQEGHDDSNHDSVIGILERVIGNRTEGVIRTVSIFNDSPGRTLREINAVIREANKILAGGGM